MEGWGTGTSCKAFCRDKRSICLDLRAPEAVEPVRRLAAGAAALVDSLRPGVLEEMGLAPDTLLELNPRLVIVRIAGWGQTGPYRHKPSFGMLVEGYSGYAAVNGFADREPVLPPMFHGGLLCRALWRLRRHDRAVPRLGEHNDAVLRPVLGAETLAALRAKGVVRGG